jgi:hypothetical protein
LFCKETATAKFKILKVFEHKQQRKQLSKASLKVKIQKLLHCRQRQNETNAE